MLVADTIAYALRVAGILGVGQVALPQDTDDATLALALMLAQWQRKRWLVYRLEDVSIKVNSGRGVYNIGPSADTTIFYPDRPGSIEAAYIRQLTGSSPASLPVDYPLARISSREEWSQISLKQLHSWPSSYFYDPSLPDGLIYIWPVPVQEYFELHFSIPQDLGASLHAEVEIDDWLPPETEEALVYNLAMRLRLNYQLPPDPGLAAAARASLNTLRQTNFAMQPLRMPAGLMRGGRWKNPYGGFVESAVSIGTSVLR
jgi:hypothetical protein